MHKLGAIAAAAGLLLSGSLGRAQYVLDAHYDADNFFQSFDFFTEPDPTHGFVDYVDVNSAHSLGLAGNAKGTVYMGVDYTEQYPANGRKSVRLQSQRTFTRGLFIADIAHMPGSICGTWPAYWMFGPEWPVAGEIDILEGVNTQTKNSITLHTSNGCTMSNHGSLASTYFVGDDCAGSDGCGMSTADNQNYGDGFNNIGGGVYAMDWTADSISVWFFPRTNIPHDISGGTPNPTTWGQPVAKFAAGNSCSMDSHFSEHQIVFDTTFCGDWAGQPSIWAADAECSALAATCEDYVSANPSAFKDAYWEVNSIKVYQQSGSQVSSTAPTAIEATVAPTLQPTLNPTLVPIPSAVFDPAPVASAIQSAVPIPSEVFDPAPVASAIQSAVPIPSEVFDPAPTALSVESLVPIPASMFDPAPSV